MINPVALLENINDSMVLVNREGEIVFINNIARTYENLSRIPLTTGISFYDVMPPEYVGLTKILLDEVIEKKASQATEAAFKHPSGHTVYFDLTYKPILDDYNNVTHVLVVGRDITSQKTFERKSSQVIRELFMLIEHANAIIFGIDRQQYITEWNHECTRWTGREKDEALARPLHEILPETLSVEFRNVLETVFSGKTVKQFEFRIKRDDTIFTILLNVNPKLSLAGQIIGAIFFGQDVTELLDYKASLEMKVEERTLKLQEALQQEKELVELRNKLVSIASHEFKIPLSAINTSVNALRKSVGLLENERKYIDIIDAHVSRMKQLLEDILQAKKNDNQKIRANHKPIDIVSFMEHLASEVAVASAYSHAIKIKPSEPVVFLLTDEKLLRNVFVNLLSNAIKFSPGKDEVLVTIDSQKEFVVVRVTDHGIGISRDETSKIFEPFTRGANVGSIKGTGLGLSIVKKAVETLEGTIDVKSAVGEGTTFAIKFKKSLTNLSQENEIYQNITR